jgi:hypothetical protein
LYETVLKGRTMSSSLKRNEFAAHLERAINASLKTQNEISSLIGYDNPNIITMFKKGTTRVPLEKVAALAIALDLDPGVLMQQWFEAYMPDATSSIKQYIGGAITREERVWIDALRETFGSTPTFSRKWVDDLKTMVCERAA